MTTTAEIMGERRAELAARMRALRLEKGFTQEEAATALGISQPTYHAMENGDSAFRRRDLVTLAHLFGMPLPKAFPGVR